MHFSLPDFMATMCCTGKWSSSESNSSSLKQSHVGGLCGFILEATSFWTSLLTSQFIEDRYAALFTHRGQVHATLATFWYQSSVRAQDAQMWNRKNRHMTAWWKHRKMCLNFNFVWNFEHNVFNVNNLIDNRRLYCSIKKLCTLKI